MIQQKRDTKGKFISDNPKPIVMRVTEQEKRLIERYRQIKSPVVDQDNHFYQEIRTIICKRVQNLEL